MDLIKLFHQENYSLHQLNGQSMLSVTLQAGLSSLKTPYPEVCVCVCVYVVMFSISKWCQKWKFPLYLGTCLYKRLWGKFKWFHLSQQGRCWGLKIVQFKEKPYEICSYVLLGWAWASPTNAVVTWCIQQFTRVYVMNTEPPPGSAWMDDICNVIFLWFRDVTKQNSHDSVETLYRELLGVTVVHYDNIYKGLRWGNIWFHMSIHAFKIFSMLSC